MDIKKLANSVLNFALRRLIEIAGIIIFIIGILLFISLISYSPEDPNFIFSENTKINNFLGYQGSYISDLFLQSIGIISYLIPLTFLITGINIFKRKNIFLILENTFFIVVYSIIGSSFFNFYYTDAFELYINGNGGFVGNYINQLFLGNIISINENIFYYSLIILIFILFLFSINFQIKNFVLFINFFTRKTTKNYEKENEVIKEYIPQQEIKNLIQEDLPFIKADQSQSNNQKKFRLPPIDLLKIPSKQRKGRYK